MDHEPNASWLITHTEVRTEPILNFKSIEYQTFFLEKFISISLKWQGDAYSNGYLNIVKL